MILADEAASTRLGAAIAARLRPGDVVALQGPLGAGKTTLARAILVALGLEGEAPSPTFAIVQPYDPPAVRVPVCHVDLYRLDGPEDAEELGLDDALADGALLVEWPERMGARLWPEALILAIEPQDDGCRRLTATVPAPWEERWPP